MLRRFPIESKGRRKKLHEVCFSCLMTWSDILEGIYLLHEVGFFTFKILYFNFLVGKGLRYSKVFASLNN